MGLARLVRDWLGEILQEGDHPFSHHYLPLYFGISEHFQIRENTGYRVFYHGFGIENSSANVPLEPRDGGILNSGLGNLKIPTWPLEHQKELPH